MKKRNTLVLLMSLFMVVGCNQSGNKDSGKQNQPGGGSTTHTWASAWSKDETNHWHACTETGCNEKNDSAAHIWDAGQITKEASVGEDGEKTYTCTVCTQKKKEKINATGPAPAQGEFTIVTDLTKVNEIHTADQKRYLAFTGQYYNITSAQLTSFNATGNDEHSLPNPVKLQWAHTPTAGKTIKNYGIKYGQKQDLSDGYEVVGTTAKSLDVYNSYLGDNYFRVIAHYTDNSTEQSDIKVFKVDTAAPRNLKIGSMSNCRDMGGRTTIFGGKIKQGLIYRTAQPSDRPSTEEKEVLMNQLGLKSEIYVKDGGGTSSALGSTVKYFNCSMDYGSTPYSNLSRNAERVRKVFDVISKEENYPTFYHCRIGTDRTGICATLINGLLGVDFNEIIQDYAFSNFAPIDGQRYTNKASDPNGDDPAKYIEEIKKMPGANFQEKTYNTLLCLGVPATQLDWVINFLTEGTKPTNNNGQQVKMASDLTLSGTTLSSGSDFKDPDKYAKISSGKSVSCNFTVTAKKTYTVIAYLGSTESSSSTKLAAGIELKIGSDTKTIRDITMYKAGFGKTKQSSRTGYMVQYLGEWELEPGTHTITLSGKSSTVFNVGSLALI